MGKIIKTIVILGGIALLGYGFYYYYVQQSALLSQITIAPQSVVITGDVTSTNVPMQVNLLITNPSNISAQVQMIFVNIYANGILLGTATTAQPFVIPAVNSDGSPGVNVGQLNLIIDPSKLVNISSIISIISLKGVNVVVNGYATVAAPPAHLQIPINFTQEISV